MSDHIDTREGWVEVGASDNHQRRLVEYDEHNRVTHIWVREAPVPPFPTVPGTVIRVTWAEDEGRTSDYILRSTPAKWLAVTPGATWAPADLHERITGFEVLSEPRAVTAKAVLDYIWDTIGDDYFGTVISEHFGVES